MGEQPGLATSKATMLYHHLPNWPEDRIRPLMETFGNIAPARGALEYEAPYPDGRRETILSMPDYDFNWQIDYSFAEPLPCPAAR